MWNSTRHNFDQLIQVLSKEPSTNPLSAANITAIMSVIIAFALGALAYWERDARRRARDAGFLFQSEKDYGKLLVHLIAVGDWAKKTEVKIQLEMVDVISVSEMDTSILDRVQIPDEIWQHAREIKTHFKAIAKFHRKRIVSSDAIELALDHWGYRLFMDVIRRMDVYRFYYARRDSPDSITPKEFSNDFGWYSDLGSVRLV